MTTTSFVFGRDIQCDWTKFSHVHKVDEVDGKCYSQFILKN